jgi:hypothetical protein
MFLCIKLLHNTINKGLTKKKEKKKEEALLYIQEVKSPFGPMIL